MPVFRRRRLLYLRLFLHRLRTRGITRLVRDMINQVSLCLLARRSLKVPDPLYVQIEPTSECNLQCRMCVQNSPDHKVVELSRDEFCGIIDSLPSVIFCNIQGNGEPLLNPHLIDMIRYASDKGMATITCTNAMLLNDQLTENLVTSGLYECAVSLESPHKDQFEYLRTGADFEVFKHNVQLLAETRNRLNPYLILSFWTTITNQTQHHVEDCIQFAAQIGFDHIVFQKIQHKEVYRNNYSNTFEIDKLPLLSKPISKKEFLRRYKPVAAKHGITISLPSKCLWPWSGFFVMANGDVTPCCSIHGLDDFLLGNINHLSMNDIWTGKQVNALRKALCENKSLSCCDKCNFS